MNKYILGTGTLLAVLLLSACTTQPVPSPTPASDQTPAASISSDNLDMTDDKVTAEDAMKGAREIKLDAFSYGFTPKTIEVSKGEKIKLVVSNKGGMHDITIADFNVKKNLSTTAPTEVEFTADKVGTFEFHCSVGNHAAQGMKGTIVVK